MKSTTPKATVLEFILINVSLYDIKVYRGDFEHLEILQQYDFDELPQDFIEKTSRIYTPEFMGVVPYKTILVIKTVALRIVDLTSYQSLPVIVTGIDNIKELFLRFFEPRVTVLSEANEDYYEKSCAEILERSKVFRTQIYDYYTSQRQEREKKIKKIR